MPVDLVGTVLDPQTFQSATILHLFSGPAVGPGGGARWPVPEGSKRLLVFVALHAGHVDRRHVAGVLWPIGDDKRAAGNLRSALWRLNRADINVLVATKHSLALRDDVLIDIRVVGDWAARIIAGRATAQDLTVLPECVNSLELLPGWSEDWVVLERERFRQRLLHALEALSRAHRRAGRSALAVQAALVAVNAEPLRESAQRELLESHLAEGNWNEVRRGYELYRTLLRREFRAEPAPQLQGLLRIRPRPADLPREAASPAAREVRFLGAIPAGRALSDPR